MMLSAYFTLNGEPKTALSPTISVLNVATGAAVVSNQAMTEVGLGWYRYDFVGFDAALNYVMVCDGGATLTGSERYVAMASSVEGNLSSLISDLMNDVIEGTISIKQAMRLFLAVLVGISSGGGGNTVVFKDTLGVKDRVEAVVDSTGNRITVALDAT
jgi:hypothetical protein